LFSQHHHGSGIFLVAYTCFAYFRLVSYCHFAHAGTQVTTRYVFMHFARFKYRLLTYYTFSFYFPNCTIRIVDKPMPT